MARLEGPDYLHFKWANQRNVYASKFHYLFEQERWVDVTLKSADGQFLKAHRLILSASSQYFEDIFTHHPLLDFLDTSSAEVNLDHIRFHDLKLLIEYMYKGEVNVTREQLPSFVEAAATLQIKELIEQAQEISTAGNGHSMDPTPSSSSQSPTQSNALATDANNFIIMKDAESVLREFDDLIADPPLQLKLLDNNHHGELMDDTPNCSQELQLSESSDEFEELHHFTRRNIPEDYATGVETENQTKAKWNKSVNATREGIDKLKHQRKSPRLASGNSSKGNAPLPCLSDDSDEEEDKSSSKDSYDDDEPLNEVANSGTSAVPKRKANKKTSGSKLAKKVRRQASTPDERPFKCCKCGCSYKRKQHLSRHSRLECGVEAGHYPCSICDFRAKRRENLQYHLIRFHEVDPSQLKIFNAEPKFNRSRQPHKQQQVHKCIKCSRTFKQKMNLERHVKDECQA